MKKATRWMLAGVLASVAGLAVISGSTSWTATARAADAVAAGAETYTIDAVHSSALFRAHHANAGYTWGRINDPKGTFTLDAADPSKSSFKVEIPVANIDTHNEKRDAHLKSPDFFNAKQYPTLSFQSTSVSKGEGNMLNLTGDLTIHGVTKSITVPLELTGKGEVPPGVKRAGVETTFTIKLTDFEMKAIPGALDNEIKIIVSLEGTR